MDTQNTNDPKDYHPMKLADQMERNKHILLLYDDLKYAYWIIGEYFHNGFAKGDTCVFFTSDNHEIIERIHNRNMVYFGQYSLVNLHPEVSWHITSDIYYRSNQ